MIENFNTGVTLSVGQISRQSVWIWAFDGKHDEPFANRCRGLIPPPPSLEECVLYAGHTGVSFGSEQSVYGFLPYAPNLQPSELLRELKNSKTFPGRVDDHRSFFDFATIDGSPVIKMEFLYTDSVADRIRQNILEHQNACTARYAFPGTPNCCNCITWLESVGLKIPDNSGQMKLFIPALQALLPQSPLAV